MPMRERFASGRAAALYRPGGFAKRPAHVPREMNRNREE
jgi:hypothetical protein